jgi:hypothetical protein
MTTPAKLKPRRNATLSSVADVIALLRRHDDGIFVYRGENSTSYPLLPKLGRSELPEGFEWADAEATLLDAFKRRSTPFLTSRPLTELQWLTLAQHHGLATRLLDWTLNPLVALYFALTPDDSESDRVLYALCTDEFLYVDDTESPFSQGKFVLYEPVHLSPRVGAQRGLFLIHPSPTVPFTSRHLERLVIKGKSVIQMLVDLESLGVSHETMFPGIGGVAKQANAEVLGI